MRKSLRCGCKKATAISSPSSLQGAKLGLQLGPGEEIRCEQPDHRRRCGVASELHVHWQLGCGQARRGGFYGLAVGEDNYGERHAKSAPNARSLLVSPAAVAPRPYQPRWGAPRWDGPLAVISPPAVHRGRGGEPARRGLRGPQGTFRSALAGACAALPNQRAGAGLALLLGGEPFHPLAAPEVGVRCTGACAARVESGRLRQSPELRQVLYLFLATVGRCDTVVSTHPEALDAKGFRGDLLLARRGSAGERALGSCVRPASMPRSAAESVVRWSGPCRALRRVACGAG